MGINQTALNTSTLNSALAPQEGAAAPVRDYLNNFIAVVRTETVSAEDTQIEVGAEAQVYQPGTLLRATLVNSLSAPTKIEIVDITDAVVGEFTVVLTLDRGKEGTLPLEWGKDDLIEARLTAGLMKEKVHSEEGKGLSSNDFTDALKSKLGSIFPGATKNASDAALRDRSTHTGEQAIGTITGLLEALASKAAGDDSRLSDAREWTATTVSQAEAEAGVGITRRAWTAQRVRQAITAAIGAISSATQTAAGWMSAGDKTKLDGIAIGATANATDAYLVDRSNHTGTQDIDTIAELQATLDGKATSAQGAKADSALQPTGSTADDLTVTALTEPTGVAASEAIDRSDGRYQQYTMTAATTFSVALAEGQVLDLYVSGGDLNTPTWPTMVWIGGAPTLAANSVIRFTKVGGTLYGEHVGDY